MTIETVTPAEPADQPERKEQRAKFVAGLREFATWLEDRPWAPTARQSGYDGPAGLQIDLFGSEGLTEVRAIADQLGMKVDQHLDDRTSVRVTIGSVAYSVIAWHPTEVADEPAADPTGLLHSRADDADDPTPASPAREPLHTGAVTDGGLVDETEAPPRAGVVEVAGGRVVHECCGKLDDAEHRNFCKKYVRPALLDAHKAALDEDNERTKAAVIADLRPGEHKRIANPGLARFLAHREYDRRVAADTVPIPAEDATLTPLHESASEAR